MHRIHSDLTVAAPIAAGKSESLRSFLKALNQKDSNFLSNSDSSKTTLFVSGVILPAQDYHNEQLPETLVFATTFCGPLSEHLEDLIKTNKKELCDIFKHCKDFPQRGLIRDQDLINYLKSHRYKSAFNSRYQCITKDDVKKEKNLREEIEGYLDKAQSLEAFDGLSALEVKGLIERHIKTRGIDYGWTYKRARMTLKEFAFLYRGPIVSLFAILLIIEYLRRRPRSIPRFIALGVTGAVFLAAIVYYISRAKTIPAERPDDVKLQSLAATQLHPVINEMTAAGPLKKGRSRRYFYATALRVIRWFAPILMKIPTVSSIRWLVIDNKKRLVFLANYSNTTDFYVRDFLNGATPRGVNFMFTNGQGFPDAKMLLGGGITENPEGYMDAVHTGQQVTDLWYAHEPSLTSDIINKNRKIRNGLFREMTEEEARQWLKLL